MSQSDSDRASDLSPLGPEERFRSGGTDAQFSVKHFWAWSLGDLRMNTARGFLAEYLVARAVGATAPTRVEWAPFDVEAADGTRIEVKASGYTQSWSGPESKPRYSFKSVSADQQWDESSGKYLPVGPHDRVQVWVFALHLARREDEYDQLDLDSWEFRVTPHAWLLSTGQTSAGLAFFERHGIEPVKWAEIREAVRSSRTEHERLLAAS